MKKAIYFFLLFLLFGSYTQQNFYTHQFSFSGSPQNAEQLGEMLFFDKRLSKDNSISCGSCHIPAFAFADTLPLSKGVDGKFGKRNAPSVTNMAAREAFFFDGRAKTLEDQVHFPIEDPLEMNLNYDVAVERIKAVSDYQKYFSFIYNSSPNKENIASAIAAFERTLETSNTPFDRFMKGDSLAISLSAMRGRQVFMSEKAKCFDCHFSPDFTVDDFRNIGLYDGVKLNDVGRFGITKDSIDLGRFKVPGLRNVGVTAPYMHNGMFKTLREIIDYYDNPKRFVANSINADSLLQKPLNLTEQEKTDLEAFLLTLTDKRFTP